VEAKAWTTNSKGSSGLFIATLPTLVQNSFIGKPTGIGAIYVNLVSHFRVVCQFRNQAIE
jgi:hypothetical protein